MPVVEGKSVTKCAHCPVITTDLKECVHKKMNNVPLNRDSHEGVPHWCPEVTGTEALETYVYFDPVFEGEEDVEELIDDEDLLLELEEENDEEAED